MTRKNRVHCTCKLCGKEFDVKASRITSGRGIYCSKECRAKGVGINQTGPDHPRWSTQIIYCTYCGKELYRPFIRRTSTQNNFCNISCKQEWQKINYIPHNKSKIVIQTCTVCKKKFETSEAMLHKNRGICCSPQCRAIYVGTKKRGENHPRWTSEKVKCEGCGKEFYRANWHLRQSNHKFCSKLCRDKTLIGELASQWKGGLSFEPYCEKFNEDLKERVRTFFNHTCVYCGKLQNGKSHSVHHVNYNKDTCCSEGPPLFVPLCSSCHPKTNSNREYWELYFRELIALQYGGKCYYTKEEMAAITSPADIIPLQPLQQISGQTEQRIPTSSPQRT